MMYRWFRPLAIVLSFLILGFLIVGTVGLAAPEASPRLAPSFGTAFTYQGYIEDSGLPANGSFDLRFSLFNDPTAGTLIAGPLTYSSVNVINGLFTVTLDFGGVFNGAALWLLLEVHGPSDPGYTALSPRQPVTPAPYAINADRLDGLDAVAFASYLHNHAGESWAAGNVESGLSVSSTSSSGSGLTGINLSEGVLNTGVEGIANSTHGRGVAGTNNANSGPAIGMYGESMSPSGWGVYGYSSAGTGTAGESDADDGIGVLGIANGGSSATGVWGYSGAPNGYGVEGSHTALTGPTIGVAGFTESSDDFSRGVYGFSAGFGVYGFTRDGTGVGGESQAIDGIGVEGNGWSTGGTDLNYGVYGRSNSTNGYGGFFVNTSASGYLLAANDSMSTSELEFKVSNDGNVYADGNYYGAGGYYTGSADFAELVTPDDADLEAGDVLVIKSDGTFTRSTQPFQTAVIGVYSSNPGYVGGASVDDHDELIDAGKIPLAIVGIVPVKASAENGAIQPGDLLVSASMPGYAMAAGEAPPIGTVIGKALEPLQEGTGFILMLVLLQ